MRATKVNVGLAESNGRLLLGIWRDSLHVTCGLTACTPGSAPGPTLGNEYGKTLPLPYCRSAVCIYCSLCSVYAVIPQTDRATRYVSRNLVNCGTTVGTGCTTNPQQIGVMELERYGRRTCSKPRASSHDAVHRRKCGQQARQSISFVNFPHDRMPWRNMHLVKVNLTQGRFAAARGSVYIIQQGPY